MNYRLLKKFGSLFEGQRYLHRVSTHGDSVATELFEDLYALGRSSNFNDRVDEALAVLNTKNKRRGISARRGDGSFGEIVPGEAPISDDGFVVKRGEIATIQIGVEVKILAKAMIKQIDRVVSDLGKQVTHFESRGGKPVTVGIVGVNWASHCCSYEGDRSWPTDGKKHKHPAQEASEASNRLMTKAAPQFDEFILLPYIATNMEPYRFSWKDQKAVEMDYGAALARISALYQQRF